MARKARGRDLLEQAKGYLSKAKTAEELRQAQAFVMPLEFGLSMEHTARAIGVSTGWACQLRNRFIREGGIPRKDKPLRGGRRRANMNVEEEEAFLAPFFDKAKEGGILVVSEIKNALDQRLGRIVAYNLLHRHDFQSLLRINDTPNRMRRCSLKRAVPSARSGWLKISTNARQMIRSCSTCSFSGQGAAFFHSEMKSWGIIPPPPQ